MKIRILGAAVLLMIVIALVNCTGQQIIMKNIAGSWKVTAETDTLGLGVPLGNWNIVYTFNNCSSGSSCGGSISAVQGNGSAKPNAISWTLNGSYLDIIQGGVTTKFNVMSVSKKNLTIQYLAYPKAHFTFAKK